MHPDNYQPLTIGYQADDPKHGPRVPAIAWPLVLAGAICTLVGLVTASGIYARWIAPPTLEAYDRISIIAMLLVVYVGQPLCFAALLIVRRPWSRERAPCRITHPVPLLALAVLAFSPMVGLAMAALAQLPHLAGACGCAPVLLLLALLLWFGGMPTRMQLQRHIG